MSDTMPPEDSTALNEGCSAAERMRIVRDEIARQNAKFPKVDHNGHPIDGA